MKSNPASDARLQKAPAEVRVTFSEPPDPRGSVLQVFDTSGREVDTRDTAPTGGSNELRVGLREIGTGGYTVAWTVVSAVDGHETKGSFAFAVGDAELPKIADVPDAVPPPRPVEVAGRVLSYAGIALALGLGAFGLVVRPFDVSEDRRTRLVLALGGALLAIGATVIFLDQGERTPARLVGLLSLRGLAGVAIVLAVAALAPPRARIVGLVAGVVAAATATAASHAAASGGILDQALDLVHLLAASAWAGGVVTIFAIVAPSEISRRDPSALGRGVWRFSLLALVAVAVIIVTGTAAAFGKLVLLQDLWETPYGLALLAKILLLAATLVFGAANLLVLGPRLRSGIDVVRSNARLIRTTLVETLLLALVLGAVGILTALAPPAQPSGAPFDETREVGGLRLELLLATTNPGQNRFVLRIHQGLTPVAGAQKVAFRFTMIEHDMGESELVAEERAPGEYVAAGNTTVMTGTWRIQTIVRLTGREDVSTIFEVPITTVAGPGAVARVINAAPYTLVAYIDPPQPLAGAPANLNVVVVDGKGDPARGKPVRVTFSGPGTQVVNATESSPGHYEAAVAALDAGKWTATIAIGSEASGDYVFDVAR